MFNMKKVYIFITIMFILFITSSCSKTTIINEVINREVIYGENISILDFEDAIVEASNIASKTVVAIKTETKTAIMTNNSFASGVVISKTKINDNLYSYYVITNKHVVATNSGNLRTVYISFSEGDTYSASVCKLDDTKDIAIISFECPRILEVARVATKKTEVGRFVIAVGNPYDVDKYYSTITVGNVSYVDRIIIDKIDDNKEVRNLYIQHNAEINHGNSGGGLFNIKGELLGINTWKIANEDIEGMGFAIPIDSISEDLLEYFQK